ncbi:MAG: DsbA family protein [Psychromonas sp.]|nr:DsbA family protein [Alteromonadales bacterium]MCP5078955.1 DsbA family protein [Psychromonas sp.]
MSSVSTAQEQLFFVYDPMCSWCWGYRPTWLTLQQAIQAQLPNIEITYLVGGLAADSNKEMPLEMQQFLKQTWQKIGHQLGTKFNLAFWDLCQPRYSTYPACRACIIARQSGLEAQMILAIQEAYYLQAKNPSDNSTLIALAGQIGINKKEFEEQLLCSQTQQQLLNEIQQTQMLPIQGFPSLILRINQQDQTIPLHYQYWENSFGVIEQALNIRS